METDYDGVTLTVIALADGSTSLYLSNGGGVIGGHSHESVRQASQNFLRQANDSLAGLKRCEIFPIPDTAQTVFYVLTDSGMLTGGALENDLAQGTHPLSSLFHTGNGVVTEMRLMSGDDA